MERPKGESGKTILVVEDAEAIRRLVCSTLTFNGFSCLEAADGVEALEVCERHDAELDLVLTDMVMPRMDGKELAEQLTRRKPALRLMFMSGFTDDPIVRVFEHREAIFLAKPFTASVLLDKVRHALAQPWNGLPPLTPSL